MAGILYEIDSQGRIIIESKEQLRARGIPSPDRAEALMQALGELPPEYAYYSIRDRGRLALGDPKGGASSPDDSGTFPTMMMTMIWCAASARHASLEHVVGPWRSRRNGGKW